MTLLGLGNVTDVMRDSPGLWDRPNARFLLDLPIRRYVETAGRDSKL